LVERVREEGKWLMDALHGALGQHPRIGDIRGRGFFIGTEFVADRDTKEPFDPSLAIFDKIRRRAWENGLICYPVGGNVDGRRGDHAILAPPYNASRAELEEIVDKFVTTCREVL
jgi:adenosylmethionine-8-amino-7-oxononanoate aminotransferase